MTHSRRKVGTRDVARCDLFRRSVVRYLGGPHPGLVSCQPPLPLPVPSALTSSSSPVKLHLIDGALPAAHTLHRVTQAKLATSPESALIQIQMPESFTCMVRHIIDIASVG